MMSTTATNWDSTYRLPSTSPGILSQFYSTWHLHICRAFSCLCILNVWLWFERNFWAQKLLHAWRNSKWNLQWPEQQFSLGLEVDISVWDTFLPPSNPVTNSRKVVSNHNLNRPKVLETVCIIRKLWKMIPRVSFQIRLENKVADEWSTDGAGYWRSLLVGAWAKYGTRYICRTLLLPIPRFPESSSSSWEARIGRRPWF